MDYPTKTGLIKYPGEDQLLLEKDGSYSSSGYNVNEEVINDDTTDLKRPLYKVIMVEDEESGADDTETKSKDTKRVKVDANTIHQASQIS
jgi:hypothetical protein